MLRPAVLAWLVVSACAARGEEATSSASAATQPLRVTTGALLQTDYIYRGISYSAHQPSVGAYVDVQQGWLYAWTNFNSVKFSTRPAVEMTMALGVRPVFGAFEFDFGSAYYYYPGEVGPDRSNYWESHATVAHKLTEKLTLGGTVTYAPNVWLSGAWGWYAGSSFALDLPNELLPSGLTWSLSGDVGRALFGNTSLSGGRTGGGGLPPAAYTNWRASVTFNYNLFKLALNYTDTNLSKESCYVLTGDLAAIPGGIANPDNNPLGLRSALCGATFSATLGFEFRAENAR